MRRPAAGERLSGPIWLNGLHGLQLVLSRFLFKPILAGAFASGNVCRDVVEQPAAFGFHDVIQYLRVYALLEQGGELACGELMERVCGIQLLDDLRRRLPFFRQGDNLVKTDVGRMSGKSGFEFGAGYPLDFRRFRRRNAGATREHQSRSECACTPESG